MLRKEEGTVKIRKNIIKSAIEAIMKYGIATNGMLVFSINLICGKNESKKTRNYSQDKMWKKLSPLVFATLYLTIIQQFFY